MTDESKLEAKMGAACKKNKLNAGSYTQ